MYVFLLSNVSLGHCVNKRNSFPTRHTSPVRRHTTVGVPEKLMSFSYSWYHVSCQLPMLWLHMDDGYITKRVRWMHFSINTKSSSVRFIISARNEGRNNARARLIRIKSSRFILFYLHVSDHPTSVIITHTVLTFPSHIQSDSGILLHN